MNKDDASIEIELFIAECLPQSADGDHRLHVRNVMVVRLVHQKYLNQLLTCTITTSSMKTRNIDSTTAITMHAKKRGTMR